LKRIWLRNKKKYAIIDDEDFEIVSQYRWCRNSRYALTTIYRGKKKKTVLLMHRFLLNAPKHLEVDHINHNGLDNRRANLRLVTKSQNHQNKRGSFRPHCKYKGIYWHTGNKRWIARLKGKLHKHLGSFKNKKEAAKAYDKAAKKYFGEFACLNFPNDK